MVGSFGSGPRTGAIEVDLTCLGECRALLRSPQRKSMADVFHFDGGLCVRLRFDAKEF